MSVNANARRSSIGTWLSQGAPPARWAAFALAALIALYGLWKFLYPDITPDLNHPLARGLSFERLTNTHFVADHLIPEFPPRAETIKFPIYPGDFANWGSVGRDHEGHIWFATSSFRHPTLTARLYEYDQASGAVAERGDVLSELSKAGLLRPGEQQPKIHTRIIQAGDGHLYFASMDEPRPGEVGHRPPPWGSHLWRLRLPERKWEHLLTAAEGLIALTGGGGYVFALAFPDHTLIRYDVQTGDVSRVVVGSVDGHISRQLFMDWKGHVYVPRLRSVRHDHNEHTLVEFNADLEEIGESPLREYQFGSADQCHGITAFQHLADRSIVFTTHAGRLFRVVPRPIGAAQLHDLGWFHPDGRAYSPALFTESGQRHLYGLALRRWNGGRDFVWVHYDLAERRSRAMTFRLPLDEGTIPTNLFLYGCQTIDDEGAFYIAGGWTTPAGAKPILLRVTSEVP